MKMAQKMEFLIAVAIVTSLLISIYGPIYYFGIKVNKSIGNTESEFISQFGQPDLEITIQQIESKPESWSWWGKNYAPKPTMKVSHKVYGYHKQGFVIFWVYINQQGIIEHVVRVGT